MEAMPTYLELFGSDEAAIEYYKGLFPTTTATDPEIIEAINISYTKISFVFGEFRRYEPDEDTLRNDAIRKAVCFEANSILSASGGNGSSGGLNDNLSVTGAIISEKMEDVSITYAEGGNSGSGGLGDSSLAKTLGLLSNDAAIILSRYIRKSYLWNEQ